MVNPATSGVRHPQEEQDAGRDAHGVMSGVGLIGCSGSEPLLEVYADDGGDGGAAAATTQF